MNPKLFRIGMNVHPLYFCTGGHVDFISKDWRRVELSLPLNWRTRNYVGTIFGGSLFSASDPFYMIMFINILGTDFVVWDKGAQIKFKRPGTSTVRAVLEISDAEVAEVKAKVLESGEFEFTKTIQWKDREGNIISEVERLMYAATKQFYNQKRAEKAAKKAQVK